MRALCSPITMELQCHGRTETYGRPGDSEWQEICETGNTWIELTGFPCGSIGVCIVSRNGHITLTPGVANVVI